MPTTYLVSKRNFITIQKHVLCYYKFYFYLAEIQLCLLQVLAISLTEPFQLLILRIEIILYQVFGQVKENTATYFQPMFRHSSLFQSTVQTLVSRVTQPNYFLPACNFDKYYLLFITCTLTSYFQHQWKEIKSNQICIYL